MIRETIPTIDTHRIKRIGFKPDVLIQVVGTSYENRQSMLKRVHPWCSIDQTPPAFLEREPKNNYDPGAVAVYIGTFMEDGDWMYEHVGYLPRDYSIPCRATNGQFLFDEQGTPERRAVHQILDAKWGEVMVGVDGIYTAGGGWGLRLGLAHMKAGG